MTTTHKAVCSHCSSRCGVLVDVDDGVPIAIRGDASHPLSKGFICPRGRAAIEHYQHPNRLNVPLKRSGKRGEGKWVEVDWDQALDDIAERLADIVKAHGPEALAYFYGTFHGTDQGAGIRFLNQIGSPNYVGNGFVCQGPKLEAEALTFGIGPATPDLIPGETAAILVWANRPSASNPPNWTRLLAIKRASAKLVVIDPVRTPEARAADLWLQIRPNTDAALALGLIRLTIELGLYDRAFVDRWTVGFDELRARVADFPLDRVADITGIPAADIEQCARIYAAGPSALAQGLPNGMGRNAVDFDRARCCLMAITGNINRRGASKLAGPPARALSKIDLELTDRLTVEQRRKRLGSDRFRMLSEGYDLISDQQRRIWPQHMRAMSATVIGLAHPSVAFRAMLTEKPYPVKAAIVQHANVVGNYANIAIARDAFSSPNVDLVVVHDLVMTATGSLADYVLPAAHWLEKSFMYASGQNGLYIGTKRVLPPAHERRSDYDFFRDLAMRFGFSAEWPSTLEHLWDHMLEPIGIRFEDLAASERNWMDDGSSYHHETLFSATQEPIGFATPSRKIELSSSILAKCGYDPLPSWQESESLRTSAEFPLVLMTGATEINRTHLDHRHVASLRRLHPWPTARMNARTAGKHGLGNGDWIWIETALGRIRQKLSITEAIADETVEAERWWYPERGPESADLYGMLESNVNAIIGDDPDDCDAALGTWRMRDGTCRVLKADPETQAAETEIYRN